MKGPLGLGLLLLAGATSGGAAHFAASTNEKNVAGQGGQGGAGMLYVSHKHAA